MEVFPGIGTAPSIGMTTSTAARVSEASFGDGFTQRSADGLNSLRITARLAWQLLTAAQANAIDEFLRARGGHEAFQFTLPDEASPRLWTCREWTRSHDEGLLRTVTAEFREEFM